MNKLSLMNPWLWLFQAASAAALFAAALISQYVFGEEPCQICIQVRLWVLAIFACGVVGLLWANLRFRLAITALSALSVIGMGERSLRLLMLERGIGDSSCEFMLGMPDWFAVDRWLPALFEVRNLCSFTPPMPWGGTMAENLVVIAVLMLGALALTVVITLRSGRHLSQRAP